MSISYTAPPTAAASPVGRVRQNSHGTGRLRQDHLHLFEILSAPIEQAKGPDGIRRTRWVITRHDLVANADDDPAGPADVAPAIADYKVSEQLVTLSSTTWSRDLPDPAGGRGGPEAAAVHAADRCRLNEAIEISPDLVSAITGRVGRYPSKADGGPTWFGVIGDTNTPVIGPTGGSCSRRTGRRLGAVPPAVGLLTGGGERGEPAAELLRATGANPNKAWVRALRQVASTARTRPARRCSARASSARSTSLTIVEPVVGQVILIGQDFGRSPASLICQPDHRGRLLVLEEVWQEDVGLETHVSTNLKPALYTDRYAGFIVRLRSEIPPGSPRATIWRRTRSMSCAGSAFRHSPRRPTTSRRASAPSRRCCTSSATAARRWSSTDHAARCWSGR